MGAELQSDVLIVGAGIAGLMAANALRQQGYHVIVVEKEVDAGGRMATPRFGPGRADSGAQFFTVRELQFEQFVAAWQAEGLVYEWVRGWSDGSAMATPDDGHARYVVAGGMAAVPRQLAQGLDVRTGARVTSVKVTESGWQIDLENGATYHGRALLLTPPVPQSLALLAAGNVQLSAEDRSTLERITYAPCLCGLFWVKGEVNLPEPGAVQRPDAPIVWIADNRRKGVSPEATLITVHASPEHSRRWWLAPAPEAIGALRNGLRPYLERGATIHQTQLKRWRYALPTSLHPERALLAAGLPPLAFAGDAFNGPRVEGAALSGLAAADALGAALSYSSSRSGSSKKSSSSSSGSGGLAR